MKYVLFTHNGGVKFIDDTIVGIHPSVLLPCVKIEYVAVDGCQTVRLQRSSKDCIRIDRKQVLKSNMGWCNIFCANLKRNGYKEVVKYPHVKIE